MSTACEMPAGIHRRAALALGQGLVRWAQRSGGRRTESVKRADSRSRAIRPTREERIRRYEIDRQVQLDRERAVSLTGLYAHSVM